MGVFRSRLAARVLVALSQRDRPSSLRELARTLEVRDSSTQRALAALRQAGLVAQTAGRYRADARHPAPDAVLAVALADLPRREVIGDLVRANDGVEFAAFADPDLRIVYRNTADAATQLRLEVAVALIRPAVRLDVFVHDELVGALLERPELRARVSAGELLKGTVARSLPDRSRPGDFAHARALGRPHPKLSVPSDRALRRVAQRYGLAHLGLFGSAVREDLRPDSDVDVLIRFRPEVRAGFGTLTALRDDLEQLFDRDVDLVEADSLGSRTVKNIEREEVALVGRS